jgi:hypothetical protein
MNRIFPVLSREDLVHVTSTIQNSLVIILRSLKPFENNISKHNYINISRISFYGTECVCNTAALKKKVLRMSTNNVFFWHNCTSISAFTTAAYGGFIVVRDPNIDAESDRRIISVSGWVLLFRYPLQFIGSRQVQPQSSYGHGITIRWAETR